MFYQNIFKEFPNIEYLFIMQTPLVITLVVVFHKFFIRSPQDSLLVFETC